MRIEMSREGVPAQIIIINGSNANSSIDRAKLVERTSWPIFQDTGYAKVMELHASGKDDMLIYNGAGKLMTVFKHAGTVNTNLDTPDGYSNVKQAILDAVAAQG